MRPRSALFSVEPTRRAVFGLVVAGLMGLASAAAPALEPAALLALFLAVLAPVLDRVLALDPRLVVVAREAAALWRQGEATEVALVVTVPRAATVVVTDTLPDEARPRVVTHALDGGAGISRRTHAARIARRGRFAFGRVAVRTEGPLGFVRRRARVVVDTEVIVEPDLLALQGTAARLVGQGESAAARRRRRALADGRELDALRDYARGDDVRLVAWKASARRGALVVKTLRPETRQDVVVLVDAGRQLLGTLDEVDGGTLRMDGALSGALVLSSAALLLGDRVSAYTFSSTIEAGTHAASGRSGIAAIGRALALVEAHPEEPDYAAAVDRVLLRHQKRALVALFTDVTDEPAARALVVSVARLVRRHVVVVIAVGDPAVARLARLDDDEAVALAASRTLVHRQRALAAIARAGAIVVDAGPHDVAERATDAYVRAKATGRL